MNSIFGLVGRVVARGLPFAALLLSHLAQGATINAGSCSLADVQAAVNSAANGDVIKIPNGTCSWGGGINTTKQIRIEAQNYTPTKGGTMSRSVTITNNSTSGPLFQFTSGTSCTLACQGFALMRGAEI